MKTNEKGEYKFFTLKPASYPNSKAPAHIHVTIKEPGRNEYYIDEYLFDDDPFLTLEERNRQPGRGGNGILKTVEVEKGFLKSERNIYLGKKIPNYPKEWKKEQKLFFVESFNQGNRGKKTFIAL